MKTISEITEVRAARSRLDALQGQRATLAARIHEIEGAIASRTEATAPDAVAVALGEVAEPRPLADELGSLRKQYATTCKALDLQSARVLQAESDASAAANAAARPDHIEACRAVLDIASALADAINYERTIRTDLAAAGYAVHLEAAADQLEIPRHAVENMRHYLACATAKATGKAVRGRALVDLPQHGVFAGEPVTLAPDEAAGLHRAGAFDPGAEGEAVAVTGIALADIPEVKATKGTRLRLLPHLAARLSFARLFKADSPTSNTSPVLE